MIDDATFRELVTSAYMEYIAPLGPLTVGNMREYNDGAHRLVGAVRACINHARKP